MSAPLGGRMLQRIEPPDWLLALWREIDARSLGSSIEAIAVDAELRLGAGFLKGRAAICDALMSADPATETRHHVVACWSDGSLLIVHGRLEVTSITSGERRETIIGHFIELDEEDTGKVLRWSGAVGPFGDGVA